MTLGLILPLMEAFISNQKLPGQVLLIKAKQKLLSKPIALNCTLKRKNLMVFVSVARRFVDEGLSIEETAQRTQYPVDFVKAACAG